MNEKKKNGTIEFLRFVFCISVLMYHVGKYTLGSISLNGNIHLAFFPHGSIGVEFFFLVTGLFLARSIDKELSISKKNKTDIGEDTIKFIFKKIKTIFPYYILSLIMIFIIDYIVNKYTLVHAVKLLIGSIPEIFFLQMTGIPVTYINRFDWYISVMMICIAIIYPLCKKYYKTFVTLVAPLFAILILGYLGYNYSSLTGVTVWVGFTYKGMLRGLAEILLGTTAYYIANKLSELKLKKIKQVFLTLFEALTYLGVLIIVMCTFKSEYEFTALILLFIGITLTYSQITYSKNIFNNNLFNYLGKLSLPIYLTQLPAITLANRYFKAFGIMTRISIILILTFIFAIIIKKLGDYVYTKIKS